MLSHVAQLADFCRDDVSTAGGKGANLGELTRAGVRVPPGFVVTAHAYDHFLESTGIRNRLQELVEIIGEGDGASSDDIQALVRTTSWPEDLATAATSAYAALDSDRVAVRSSATAEDLPDASFAGQQNTYLNVGGADLLDSIRQCWASLFEPRAIHYRAQTGYAHLDVSIAVVVQEMVASERSGVMFTLNPITGDNSSMIIEAAFGLGEAVVSGAVTPDCYIVERTGVVLEKQIGAQEKELVHDPNARQGEEQNHWLPVAPDRQATAKLTDDEIARLAVIGADVEKHFGRPQDIEWAYADGEFYIVQARPITAVG